MNTALKPKKPRPAPIAAGNGHLAAAAPAPASSPISITEAIDPSAGAPRLGELLKVPTGASPAALRELFDRAKKEMTNNNSLMRRAKPLLLRRNRALRAFCARLQVELREREQPAPAPGDTESNSA